MKIGDIDLTSATIYRETGDGYVVLTGRRPPDAHLVDLSGLRKIKGLRRIGMATIMIVVAGLLVRLNGSLSETMTAIIMLGSSATLATIWGLQRQLLRGYPKLGTTPVPRTGNK